VEDGPVEDGSVKNGTVGDGRVADTGPEDGAPEYGAPPDGEDGEPEDGEPEYGAPEDDRVEDGEDGAPEDGRVEDGVTDDAPSKGVAGNQASKARAGSVDSATCRPAKRLAAGFRDGVSGTPSGLKAPRRSGRARSVGTHPPTRVSSSICMPS
jgi:hypothetical protein